MTHRIVLALLCVFMLGINKSSPPAHGVRGTVDIVDLQPASLRTNQCYVVADAATAADCSTGLGSIVNICCSDGITWLAVGDGAGAGAYTFNADGDTGPAQTITDGQTLLILGSAVAGREGIDIVAEATDTIRVEFDTTEVNDRTWGDNTETAYVWTINTDGAVDPILTFSGSPAQLLFNGNLILDDGVTDSPTLTLIDATNITWAFQVLDASGNLDLRVGSGSTEVLVIRNTGAGTAEVTVDGGLTVGGNAASAGFLDLLEDSDNGSNRIRFIAPASTDDRTCTLVGNTDAFIPASCVAGGAGEWTDQGVSLIPNDVGDDWVRVSGDSVNNPPAVGWIVDDGSGIRFDIAGGALLAADLIWNISGDTIDFEHSAAGTFILDIENPGAGGSEIRVDAIQDRDGPGTNWSIDTVGAATFATSVTAGGNATSAGFLDLLEDSDNGTNRIRFIAPAATADRTCVLTDATAFIPASCVAGGGGGTVDSIQGDGDVATTGAILSIDGTATGIDTSVSGDILTVALDLSEVSSGGELGGTMNAPTVDATHSGSAHHSVFTPNADPGVDHSSLAGGDGIIETAGVIAVDLNATLDGVGATSNLSGMEFTATSELALLQGCANNEILKWVDAGATWDCAADATGGGGANSFETWNPPSGTDPVASSATDTMLVTDGIGFVVDGNSGTDTLDFSFDYTNTLGGNPALLVDQCVFIAIATGGGFICEGSLADLQEQLYLFPDVNTVDTTHRIVVDTLQITSVTGNGLRVISNQLEVTEINVSDGAGLTSDTSGLEFGGTGGAQIGLLQGCAANEILKWNDGSSLWACGADVSGGTPAWEALINSADTATSYLSNNTAETVTFSFESAFGASQQFLIRQQTGNPTAGTLLDVRAADAQVTVFRAGDGTNGITVSQAGALTFDGSGDIDLPADSVDVADLNDSEMGATSVLFSAAGSSAAWDATPAIDCTDCTNLPAGAHAGTITWTGTSVLESGIAFAFGDGTDVTITHTYNVVGTNDPTFAYTDDSVTMTNAATFSVEDLTCTDCIGSSDIANNQINSEHYAAGSIDLEHMSSASVDSDNIVDATIVEADIDADEVPVNNDILTFDSTGNNFSWQTPAELSLQPLDSELTTIAALTETNDAVMFVAGGAWTADLTPAIDCTDCTNIPSGTSHTGTVTWSGTAILESGVAFQFGDASDATVTHTYANTGTNVVIAYASAVANMTTGSYQHGGNNLVDVGDAGTVVLAMMASASVDSDNIVDATIVEADINADEAPVNNDILTFDSTGSNFSWQTPAELSLQPLDSELTTIAGLTETNGAVMFVAGGAWTADLTPAIDCTDCTNVPAGAHAGTITWTGTSILETGVAFQFGDASDATITHTYANTGTNVVIAYASGVANMTTGSYQHGGNNLVDVGDTGTVTGTMILDDTVDSLDYAAASIDLEHMSSASVDSDNIVDATIVEADIDGDVVPVDGDFLQFDSTGANFTWRNATETTSDLSLVIGTNTQAWDAELDTIAALAETNGNVMFVAGGAWTSDPTPAIDCTDCTNIPAGAHAGTITWTGTSILGTGVAFQFGDASDATITHTYANTGTNVVIAYSSAVANMTTGTWQQAGQAVVDVDDAVGTAITGTTATSFGIETGGGSTAISDDRIVFEGTGAADGNDTTMLVLNATGVRQMTVPNANTTVHQPFTCTNQFARSSNATSGLVTCATVVSADIGVDTIVAADIDETVAYAFTTLDGKQDRTGGAISDDECTGEQGSWWWDSTDNAFEFCTAASGTPSTLGSATAWDNIVDPTTPGALQFQDHLQLMDWNSPATTVSGKALFDFGFSHDATTDAFVQTGIKIARINTATGALTFENLLALDNRDADGLVANAINIGVEGAGGMTNGINFTPTNTLTTAIRLDDDQITNVFSTTAHGITEAELDIIGDGLIDTTELTNDSILEIDLDVTNSPTDNFCLTSDTGSGGFTWVACAGGGSGDIEDVGDCTGPACFTSGSPDANLTFDNATSGTVTLQTVTGALGTVTASLPAATGTLRAAQIFYGLDTNTATIAINSPLDVTWNTEVVKDSLYTHSGAASNVDVGLAGLYRIVGRCTIAPAGTADETRSLFTIVLEKNDTPIVGGRAGTYLREQTENENRSEWFVQVEIFETLALNDSIELEVTLLRNLEAKFIANGCALIVEFIR